MSKSILKKLQQDLDALIDEGRIFPLISPKRSEDELVYQFLSDKSELSYHKSRAIWSEHVVHLDDA
jgi:hypothetical protein